MKRSVLCTFGCFLLAAVSHAQGTSGRISYNEKIKMQINVEGLDEQFRDLIPREHNVKKVLVFNDKVALYENEKATEKKQEDPGPEASHVRMNIKMDVPNDIRYTDLAGNQLTQQRDFMSKQFLISSGLKPRQWKFTGREKEILGYPCSEAILQTEKDTLTAWYTPRIPVSAGPGNFYGLPGMVLEAKQNEQIFWVAEKIELGEIDSKLLVKPTGGKKVTEEEYNKIVEAKRKEMQQEYGGDGNVIIKMRR
jgi:GLPGLI family protein